MILNEYSKDGLSIASYKRDMGWGFNFGLNVTFPKFLTKKVLVENRETIRNIAKYCANKIQLEALTDANGLFEKMKAHGFTLPDENDGVLLSYDEDKSAFIRPYIFSGKMDIHPFIEFNSVNEFGFTLVPGHFSDFFITERMTDSSMFGYTKDFMPSHFGIASLYLIDFSQILEEVLIHKNIPKDFDEYQDSAFIRFNPKALEVKNRIHQEIEKRTSLNKSKRIDTLIVNKKSIYDLIRDYNITSSFQVRGTTLLHVALEFGKTVFQIESFVKKYIDKKRIS